MSLGFQTALSALNTAQRALQVIGNNLANATNPTYSRQRVQLVSLTPTTSDGGLFIGRGVDISRIDRIADALLGERIRTQESEVARQLTVADHLQEVESVFGEPGPNGLGSSLAAFFASISAMSAAPEDSSLRHGVAQTGLTVADSFRLARGQLAAVQGSFDDAVTTELERINALAGELAQLNDQVVATRDGREIPATYLDRQEQLLRELSQHVDVNATRDASGRVTVVAGGSPLVSPRGQVKLEVVRSGLGAPGFIIQGDRSSAVFNARGGRLKALQDLATSGITDRIDKVDQLAHNFILEFNRAHATGVPAGGGWTELVSTNAFQDTNRSGSPLDDFLATSDLPFTIRQGSLYVNVTDTTTGAVQRTRIDVDPSSMTVGGLQNALEAVPNLTAVVDPTGKLRISAAAGFRFDFSNRVLPQENLGRTFGSDQATITAANAGPYPLANGQGFTVAVDGGPAQAVTFATGQFANIFQATPAEIAAAINSQVTGATAEVVDGRVVLRSNSTGPTSSLQLTDGTGGPLATLGLSTTAETGGDHAVDVRLSGTYTGSATRAFVVRPLGAGTIGATPGLQVEVRDPSTNALVATLDVGAGYQPGSELALVDGVRISFGAGSLAQAAGDRFEMALVAQSDTADVLAATGLGAFFTGSDATTMGVSDAVRSNPSLIAAALSGAPADNGNLLRLQGVRDLPAEGLGGLGVNRFYQDIISELGGESSRAQSTLETQNLVLESLEARRSAVSGVNVDEELLQMEQFQQTYQVAARYLQTMQQVTDILMNIAG